MLYDKQSDRFVSQNEVFGVHSSLLFNMFEVDSKLYMFSETDLIVVDKEKKTSATFSTKSLFNNTFTSFNNICKISDDEYLLGGTSGFNLFRPKELYDDSLPPHIAVTDIRCKAESIIKRCDLVSYDGAEFSIDMPFEMNSVEVYFAALNHHYVEQNKYAYRLVGFDDRWRNANSNERYAIYNNLPHGRYTLEIIAANQSGVWSAEPLVCNIIIKPPYYKTTVAYIIYALLLLLVTYIVFLIVMWRFNLYRSIIKTREQMKHAEELNQLKLKFFTNISHELLTPLSIIELSAENLLESPEDTQRSAKLIINNSSRLTRLIRQILEFRKAESANLQLRVCQGDIAKHIAAVCDNCNVGLLTDKVVSLECQFANDSMLGYFDSDKLDKIMYNLISNAIKYNKEGGNVVVELSQYSEGESVWAHIVVRDSGMGIADSQIKRIFERFYDGEYRRSGTQGTGIGMSLTKELTELHHGTIGVKSKLGKGSIFTVNLPMSLSAYNQDEIEQEIEVVVEGDPNSECDEPQDLRRSILVVEDNNELRSIVVAELSKQYRVVEATNGVEALDSLQSEDIDIVVSDVMMPQMDGLQMCKHIKSSLELSHIPVLLLTAKASEESRSEGYQSGADGYLSKPFNMKVLQARVLNMIEAKERLVKRYQSAVESDTVAELGDYNDLDAQFINKVNEIVDENIGNINFSPVDLSDALYMSKSSFYRKVKAVMGVLPLALINNKRLSIAHKMLAESKIANVSEVAYMCGFENARNFSSLFKKRYGYLPSHIKRGSSN